MTLDTYSHYLPSMGDQTARAMEDALDTEDPPEEKGVFEGLSHVGVAVGVERAGFSTSPFVVITFHLQITIF